MPPPGCNCPSVIGVCGKRRIGTRGEVVGEQLRAVGPVHGEVVVQRVLGRVADAEPDRPLAERAVGQCVDERAVDPGADRRAVGLHAQVMRIGQVLLGDDRADVDVRHEVAERPVQLEVRAEHDLARVDLGIDLPQIEVVRVLRPQQQAGRALADGEVHVDREVRPHVLTGRVRADPLRAVPVGGVEQAHLPPRGRRPLGRPTVQTLHLHRPVVAMRRLQGRPAVRDADGRVRGNRAAVPHVGASGCEPVRRTRDEDSVGSSGARRSPER